MKIREEIDDLYIQKATLEAKIKAVQNKCPHTNLWHVETHPNGANTIVISDCEDCDKRIREVTSNFKRKD